MLRGVPPSSLLRSRRTFSASANFRGSLCVESKRHFSGFDARSKELLRQLDSGFKSLRLTVMDLMANSMDKKEIQQLVQKWDVQPPSTESQTTTLPSTTPNPLPTATSPTTSSTISGAAAAVTSLSSMETETAGANPDPISSLSKTAAATTPRSYASSPLFHPVLGERVADLGYKSIYLSCIKALVHAPVWRKQRILRPERAALIAADKIRHGYGSRIPGSIIMHMDLGTGDVCVVDGQHRVGALMILAEKGHWSMTERNIVVEVFFSNSTARKQQQQQNEGRDSSGVKKEGVDRADQEVADLFREINSAEPVLLIDLPTSVIGTDPDPTSLERNADRKGLDSVDNAGSAVGADIEGEIVSADREREEESMRMLQREVLDIAVAALQNQYKGMFKPSSRCRQPHLNADVLRNDLYQSNLLARIGVLDDIAQKGPSDVSERVLSHLLAVNAAMGEQLNAQEREGKLTGKTVITALNKARSYGFYLGMDKGWMYS